MTEIRLNIALEKSGLVLPTSGDIAIFRAAGDGEFSAFDPSRLKLVNSFKPDVDQLHARGLEPVDSACGPYAAVLVNITRSKTETLGLIAQALTETVVGGVVIVDGPKHDGIESVLKQVKSVLPVDEVVSKAHGKLFWLTRPEVLPETVATWQKSLVLKANEAGFHTAPGMFSPDKIDRGSKLLAEHFDARLKGHVADLGAGWGWLAAQAITTETVNCIDLFEAEKTALDAARVNLEGHAAQFFWADVSAIETETRYDAVISNPPFHQGRAAEPALGLEFIKKAAEILKPNGSFWLVANRQLPYEAGLDRYFAHWKTLEENTMFKVALASKPRKNPDRERRTSRHISR